MGSHTDAGSGTSNLHGGEDGRNGSKDMNQNSSGRSRGQKRPHADFECSNSCDCEEFGAPLSKRINNLNIDYSANTKNAGHSGGHMSEKGGGGLPPGLGGGQGTCEGGGNVREKDGARNQQGFNYPYPADSNYYSSNQLLNRMYAARCNRNPQLKHNPN